MNLCFNFMIVSASFTISYQIDFHSWLGVANRSDWTKIGRVDHECLLVEFQPAPEPFLKWVRHPQPSINLGQHNLQYLHRTLVMSNPRKRNYNMLESHQIVAATIAAQASSTAPRTSWPLAPSESTMRSRRTSKMARMVRQLFYGRRWEGFVFDGYIWVKWVR